MRQKPLSIRLALISIVLLSACLWATIWGAVALLASR
jgi:hypothetical protein